MLTATIFEDKEETKTIMVQLEQDSPTPALFQEVGRELVDEIVAVFQPDITKAQRAFGEALRQMGWTVETTSIKVVKKGEEYRCSVEEIVEVEEVEAWFTDRHHEQWAADGVVTFYPPETGIWYAAVCVAGFHKDSRVAWPHEWHHLSFPEDEDLE
jgi:hypothetical protein